MIKSVKREIPFVFCFVFCVFFLFLERPLKSFLDLKTVHSSLVNVEGFGSPQEVIKHLTALPSTFEYGWIPRSSVAQALVSVILVRLSSEGDAMLDRPNFVPGSLDCGFVSNREAKYEDWFFMSICKGKSFFPFNNTNIPSSVLSIEIKNAYFSSTDNFISIVSVRYSQENGRFSARSSYTSLPSKRLSKNYYLWLFLGSLTCLSGMWSVYADMKSAYRAMRLRTLNWFMITKSQIMSAAIVSIGISRLYLHLMVFDQFAVLKDFYLSGIYSPESVSSVYNRFDQLSYIKLISENITLAVVVFCLSRVLEIPNAHPRIAMLSNTFILAKEQLFNFLLIFVFIMFFFGGLGFTLLSFSLSFNSLKMSMLTQSAILIGMWPFDGSTDSLLIISYLVVFGIIAYYLLMNGFLTVIVVLNFSRYKQKVEENVTEQNWFYDTLFLFRCSIIKYRKRWPSRLVCICALLIVRDRFQSQNCSFEQFYESLRYIQKVKSLKEIDIALSSETQFALKKLVYQKRHNRFNLEKAIDLWKWYEGQFGYTQEHFLHDEFSLDGHRNSLKCKRLLKDLETLRVNANDVIKVVHSKCCEIAKSIELNRSEIEKLNNRFSTVDAQKQVEMMKLSHLRRSRSFEDRDTEEELLQQTIDLILNQNEKLSKDI